MTRRLITDLASRPAAPAPAGGQALSALTDREREVLALVAGDCPTRRSPGSCT